MKKDHNWCQELKSSSHITFQLYTADIQQAITMYNKMAIFTLKVFITVHYILISKEVHFHKALHREYMAATSAGVEDQFTK